MQRYISVILLSLFCCSCQNDVDIISLTEPSTFVYSILDLSDSIHYIRINKSFICYDNAYNYVKYPDSLYYNQIDVSVELTHLNSDKIDLKADSLNYKPKDSGLFASEPNILYSFSYDLRDYSSAKLTLVISELSDTITATTPIVNHGKFLLPGIWSSSKKISFFSGSYAMHWRVGTGFFNSMSYTFHYRDFLETQIVPMEFDYEFQHDLTKGGERDFSILLADFLYTVKSRIPNIPDVKCRIFDSIDFHMVTADEFLYNYSRMLMYDPPENSLLSMTNINNGFGIFSSRSKIDYTGMRLDKQALDSLEKSLTTRHLKFVQY